MTPEYYTKYGYYPTVTIQVLTQFDSYPIPPLLVKKISSLSVTGVGKVSLPTGNVLKTGHVTQADCFQHH